jgi:hypothetical protein
VRSAERRAAPLVLAALGALGCTVGSGAGSAVGPLYALGCDQSTTPADLGTFATPRCFDLSPTFFAGNPIEDVAPLTGVTPTMPTNRLIIRMQRDGNGADSTDSFVVDVQNTFEVARCLRGRFLPDGRPDWDTREVTSLSGGVTGVPWCDWGAAAPDGGVVDAERGVFDGSVEIRQDNIPPAQDVSQATATFTPAETNGGQTFLASPDTVVCEARAVTRPTPGSRPLIHFGPLEYVRASLVPLATCPSVRLVGVAVEGSIDFIQFGEATQVTVLSRDFIVNFGQRLQANFHALLQDQRVTTAIQTRMLVPTPQMGGAIDGYFDFDLDRGRAAQPFP